ncbi:MAG: ThiF family adenylyltransferase, partial [Clostridia bacterium]|nr:ThiF family adenylyltransferase [Clostridia bacterium]
IYATKETIGVLKTEAAALRLSQVSDVKLRLFPLFYTPETADAIDFSIYDYVIDAIDTVAAKIAIIERAKAAHVPVITCLGTGNKLDPGRLLISDLYETSVCPLAKVMRHECRKRGLEGVKALWSTEPPRKTAPLPGMALPEGKRSIPASCAFVPNAAGLMIASEVTRDLIGQKETA